MSMEYIWFKNGRENRRTVDPEGKKLLLKNLPNGEVVHYSYMGDTITSEEYKRDGVRVRNVDYDPLKGITKEYYYSSDGKTPHRDGDKPAYIMTNDVGSKMVKYFKNGKTSRSGGKPSIIVTDENGVITSEQYTEGGELYDPENGKASTTRYHSNGNIKEEIFISPKSGEPNHIERFEGGGIKLKEWYYNLNRTRGGIPKHRDGDEPAVIDYYENGVVSNEEWHHHGVRHREGDEPAVIQKYEDGSTKSKVWIKDGAYHRDDKPALVSYFDDGTKNSETYYKAGKLHRDGDKPAWTMYNKDGSVDLQSYAKNGENYTPE